MNTTYAQPYSEFFRIVLMHSELDKSTGVMNLLKFVLEQANLNIDKDSKAFLAMEVPKWLIASSRIDTPDWTEKLMHFGNYKPAILYGHLVLEVLRIGRNSQSTIEPPGWLQDTYDSIGYDWIDEAAWNIGRCWNGTRTSEMARVLLWLKNKRGSYKVFAELLPLAIRARFPEIEEWISYLLNHHRNIDVKTKARCLVPACLAALETDQKMIFLRLFESIAVEADGQNIADFLVYIVNQNDESTLLRMALFLYSNQTYFSWAILALCILEDREAHCQINKYP
jgi:hypothetical protein